jgi:hypothetical protein
MAAAAPFIGMIGGMLGGAQSMSAGKLSQMEAETQAKQEEIAVISRESDRKSRLADALASQVASAGARGIQAFEGSPLTIMNEDVKREKTATGRDRLMSEIARISLKSSGAQSRFMGNMQGYGSMLKSAADYAATGN